MALASAAQSADTSGMRVALVIGNARYASIPLAHPESDAKIVSSTLRGLGFEVDEHLNLNGPDFRRVMRDFAQRINGVEGAAVFYYAGHGAQIDGRSYLLPVDMAALDEDEVKNNAIVIEDLFASRRESIQKLARIIILNAGRQNPIRRTETPRAQSALGHAGRDPTGVLIAYATAPGQAAGQGAEVVAPGGNSVFTRHLVQAMQAEGIEIEQAFRDMRIKIGRETNGRQTPWINTSLAEGFRFNPVRSPRPGEPSRIEQTR